VAKRAGGIAPTLNFNVAENFWSKIYFSKNAKSRAENFYYF